MGWTDRAPRRTLRFWVQITEGAWTMSHKATNVVTTIGVHIGKNDFHLIGLDGRFGSRADSTVTVSIRSLLGLKRT